MNPDPTAHGVFPQNPTPPEPNDYRKLDRKEEKGLEDSLKRVEGHKESIKTCCGDMMKLKDAPMAVARIVLKNIQATGAKGFDKKLFICYVINDVLHEAMRDRPKPAQLDPLSIAFAHVLPGILRCLYHGYRPEQQQKVNSLLGLWNERLIFPVDLVNYLGNQMLQQPQQLPPMQEPRGPPKSCLHLSAGYVCDLVLARKRAGVASYTSLPLAELPLYMPERLPKTPSYILDKYEDFDIDLENIDPKRRGKRSRSSTESSSSRSRSHDHRRKSRSRSRSRSRSKRRSSRGRRGRSRSRSSSRSQSRRRR